MAAPTFVAAFGPSPHFAANVGVTKTSTSFSVQSGDLLVVLAASEDGAQVFSGITGGSLTWTTQENVGTSGATARASLYTATVATTGSMTVSITTNNGAANAGFVGHQWRSHGGVGAHASSAVATSGVAPSLALTTTAANSAISYLNADWTSTDGTTRTWRTINGITPTSGNGLETDYFRDSGGAAVAIYAGRWSDAGTAGAKTTGLSAPNQRPAIVAIEIKGTAAAGPVAKLIAVNRAVMRASLW